MLGLGLSGMIVMIIDLVGVRVVVDGCIVWKLL